MYSYDEHGNRILTEQYGLHNVSFWRFNTEKYEYMDLNYSNLINIDFWKIFGNEQDLTGYQPKNLVSKSYFNGYQYYGATSLEYINKEYFYSYVSGKQVLVGGINDRQNSDFKVFPNPTSGHVTFTWKTGYGKLNLKVFQLTGTCVMNRVINRNETINIEQLPKGIYLYMLFYHKKKLNSREIVIE